ncbi:MAG: hypothetical protein R3263_10840 [Myxococcota bacterium]|nr:hypothetical protein [Myxococcota bacterium]
MHPARLRMAAIAVLGGTAVLGSYVHGFATYPDTVAAMWGGVPDALRPLYTAWMFVAAAGFFAYASWLFQGVDPEAARVGRFGFDLFNVLYVGILVPSALWMPLTRILLEASEPAAAVWWWVVRVDLWIVAVASLGLIAALLAVRPRPFPRWHRLAVIGACAFAFQTAVLDALIWPLYFPR